MTVNTMRKQLHRQIDSLPDDLLTEIADFTAFILAHRQGTSTYTDWWEDDWRQFALGQFLRETDDVKYTLADAEEVYRRGSRGGDPDPCPESPSAHRTCKRHR